MKLPAISPVLFALSAITPLTGATATNSATPAKLDGAVQSKEQSIYDRLWSLAQLYRNHENPIIEQIDLTGRFQLDYFHVGSGRGGNDFLEIRRFRMGFDSWWAGRHVELKATLDTNLRTDNVPGVFYNRFTDLFLKLVAGDEFNVRVGKFEPHFGYDRQFSDNNHKFFERSFYDDHLIGGNDYVSGVEVSGKIRHWGYLAAVYSTDTDKEFGGFNGGQAFQVEISRDFSKSLGADKALWVLDCLHSAGKNSNTNVFANYSNAAATYFDYQNGMARFVSQIAYADGVPGKGDICELMVMPSRLITEKLELIFRYQLGLSSSDNGIATKNRQERTIGNFTGDTYHAAYLGLNYYLNDQKLKVMFGEQYANLGGGTGANAGYRGWTTLAGIRFYF